MHWHRIHNVHSFGNAFHKPPHQFCDTTGRTGPHSARSRAQINLATLKIPLWRLFVYMQHSSSSPTLGGDKHILMTSCPNKMFLFSCDCLLPFISLMFLYLGHTPVQGSRLTPMRAYTCRRKSNSSCVIWVSQSDKETSDMCQANTLTRA